MSTTEEKLVVPRANPRSDAIRSSLHRLNRSNSWAWLNAVLVITFLMGTIVVLSLPRVMPENDPALQFELSAAVRGLLGLVLIFNVYMLYQQHNLKTLRNNLAEQIEIATEQKVRAETFYELAILDPLTGLYNRRFGSQRLEEEMARMERLHDPLVVLLLDLDDFKSLNDHYGHTAGDLVLQEFAYRVRRAIRASDIPVRTGGDEFMVVLPECPPEMMHHVMDRLSNFEITLNGDKVNVRFSKGWTAYQQGETPEQLITRADEGLYSQKKQNLVHAG